MYKSLIVPAALATVFTLLVAYAPGDEPAQLQGDALSCNQWRGDVLLERVDDIAKPIVEHLEDAGAHADDHRYGEAQADFDAMLTASEAAPAKFRASFNDLPGHCLDGKQSFISAAEDFYGISARVATAGSNCMTEHRDAPEGAWKSTPCRRFVALQDEFEARAMDYGDERDQWM